MVFNSGEILHRHGVAHGDYDTGVFADNLIRRGQRYGLRIVGSLKSQVLMDPADADGVTLLDPAGARTV